MNIQIMLEYQKIDMQSYKLERDFYRSESYLKVNKLLQDASARKKDLTDLSAELMKCYTQLKVLSAKLDEIDAERQKLADTDFDCFTEEKDLDRFEKNLAKLDENFLVINREIARTVKRISDIAEKNKDLNELMDKYNIAVAKAQEVSNAKLEEVKKQRMPFVMQLKNIRESQPDFEKSELYIKYKSLRAKKRMPAIVPYNEGYCAGCGMEIGVEVNKYLKEKYDYTECPHCGRIVYKLQ